MRAIPSSACIQCCCEAAPNKIGSFARTEPPEIVAGRRASRNMRTRASSSPSESSRSGSFGIGASIGVSRCVQLLQTSPIPPPNPHDVPSPIASSSTGLKGDLRSNPRTRPSVVRVSPATTDERACSVWTRTARSPHRTTNPARDRTSISGCLVLCAGQQPLVTWVGLSLKGSPLASASVRLITGAQGRRSL